MADKHEIWFFMKELRRLLQDYHNCTNEFYRSHINDDILLLSSIIYGNKIGRSYERSLTKFKNPEISNKQG